MALGKKSTSRCVGNMLDHVFRKDATESSVRKSKQACVIEREHVRRCSVNGRYSASPADEYFRSFNGMPDRSGWLIRAESGRPREMGVDPAKVS